MGTLNHCALLYYIRRSALHIRMRGSTMQDSFYLKGKKQTVTAKGIHKWITTPARDGKDLNGLFQTDVRTALKDAEEAGITSPIIVGVIPFDPKDNCALFVPKEYAIHEGTGPHVGNLDHKPVIKETKLVPEHDEFTSIVAEAVREIRDNKLKKVVLSRLNIVETTEPLDSGSILAHLIDQNPNGFNFHTPLPQKSAYLVGSSPELLIAKHGASFYSKPLAGSAARDPSRDPEKEKRIADGLLASSKDRHEHEVVVGSMRNTLGPRSVDLRIPDTPICVNTPQLWHLASPIEGKVADDKETALSLGCLLHPTPALSGFPHHDAHELLKRLEPFDRRYFGGIVGYSDSKGDGEWFIVIRSGEIQGNNITLFGGAGIVGDSDPEAEWQETKTKISTMLRAINFLEPQNSSRVH